MARQGSSKIGVAVIGGTMSGITVAVFAHVFLRDTTVRDLAHAQAAAVQLQLAKAQADDSQTVLKRQVAALKDDLDRALQARHDKHMRLSCIQRDLAALTRSLAQRDRLVAQLQVQLTRLLADKDQQAGANDGLTRQIADLRDEMTKAAQARAAQTVAPRQPPPPGDGTRHPRPKAKATADPLQWPPILRGDMLINGKWHIAPHRRNLDK